jgi:hypothetical protein
MKRPPPLVRGGQGRTEQGGHLGSLGASMLGEVRIIADETTNSLVIRAS